MLLVVRFAALLFIAALFGWILDKPASEDAHAEAPMIDKVKAVAKAANAILPKDMGGGVVMRGIRAEGVELVLSIEGLPQWEPTLTTSEMTRMMAVSTCEHPGLRTMVRQGAVIRVDAVTPGGATLPTLRVRECDAQTS